MTFTDILQKIEDEMPCFVLEYADMHHLARMYNALDRELSEYDVEREMMRHAATLVLLECDPNEPGYDAAERIVDEANEDWRFN